MAEAQNPFAQLDADSAAQNPFAKLDGPDPGAMSDLVHGVKAGGVDLPKMAAESGEYIGHAAHALGAATNSDTLSDLGNAIVAHTSAWANSMDGGPGTEQSLQGQDGGFVRRNIYGVGRGLGQMAGAAATGAAVGGAVGSVVPGPGTVAGAATGASLAMLVALPALFGGSTAESTLEKVSAAKVAEGQTPQQAENTGLAAGAITGTAAGAGQAILSKIGVGKALQPVIDNIGSAVAGSLVKTALTPTLKGFAKEAGLATVEGAAVNTGIQASVQGTEAGFGAGDGPTASGLIDAAVQGGAISGLAHGASSVVQTGKVNATTKMLGDVTADPNARADAMLGAAAVISIKSPEVAQDFATYAHNQIVNGLPIDVMPDAAYKGFADALRQQTPEQPAAVDPAAAAPQFVPKESEVAATAVPHLTDTVGGIFKATDVDGAIAAAEAAMHTVHTETEQNAATTRDGLLAEHQYYADQQDQAMRQQAFDKAQAEAPVTPAAPDNVFARHDEEQRVAEQAVRDAAFEKAQQQGDNVAQPSALSGAMTAEVTRLGNRNLNNLTTTQLAALAMHHPDPAVAEQAGQIASGRRNAAMVADTLKTPENVSTIDQTGAMRVGQTEPAAEFSTERAGEGVAAPVEVAAPARTLEATDAAVRPLKEATDADARARGQADSGTGFIPVTTEDLPDARTPASNGVSGATTLSKSEAGLLEKSAAIYGKKVQLFRQEGATNGRSLDGMVVPSQPDTIYVNADASGAHHLVVFGHELAHQMQTDAPHLYDGMQKALMKQVAKGGGNQFYRYYMNKGELSDVQARQAMSDPAVKRRMTDEFIADLTGNRFSEAQTWRKLFADNATGSKAMVYRIADFMTSFIDKLLGNTKFKQFATDDMVKNLTDVRQTIRRSLSSYAQDRGSKPMQHEADMLRAKAENKQLVTPVKAEPRADVGKPVSKAAPAPVAERAPEPTQGTTRMEVLGTPRTAGVKESTERAVTHTPEFKQWFGDSKAVDSEGKPLLLYHGTGADFSEFKPSETYENGIYFTPDPRYATGRARINASTRDGAANVMPVYVSIKDPAPTGMSIAEAKAQGHDGMIRGEGRSLEYVAFRPEQIKSATGNSGAFDRNSPDMRASQERSTLENPVKENTDGRTTKDQAGAVTGRDAGATGQGDEPAVREGGDPAALGPDRSGTESGAPGDSGRSLASDGAVKAGEVTPEWMDSDQSGLAERAKRVAYADDSQRLSNLADTMPAHEVPEAARGETVKVYKSTDSEQGGLYPGDAVSLAKAADGSRSVEQTVPTSDVIRDPKTGEYHYAPEGMVHEGESATALLNRMGSDGFNHNNTEPEDASPEAAKANPFSSDPEVRASGERALFLGKLDLAQEAAARAVGALARPKTVKQKMAEMKTDLRKKMVQGIVDQFSPIKAVSDKAYMMARMSKGTDGALEALMLYGHVTMRDGLYDVNVNGKGFSKVMASLDGEHGRFFLWVAAQRAEMLKAQGKENLFTDTDISALKTLDAPDTQHKLRDVKFAQALKDYNDFNDSVLKIAEDSGLLDAATRQLFKNQPYVPFYRVMDDEGMKGPMMKSGLVNQYAFKKLKGGGAALNQDLLANTLTNWGHLLGAASRNRAAVEAMTAAEKLGVADKIPASQAGKGTIRVLVGGKDVHYEVNDPHLLSAVSAMASTVPSWMKPLSTFKHLLTTGVTLAPGFKIRNLIRDTVSSIAIGDISANPAKNIVQGFQGTSHKSQTYASMLASGGIIRMGSMLDGNTAERAHRLIESGVDRATILDSQGAVKVLFDQARDLFEAYQELGDRSENINRAALYQQLIAKGKSHAEASFMARDLMDFSMGGNWPVVKFLTQSVPFLNARIQGLYKLGKASTENPGRVGAVIGAVSMASLALMWKYQDDKDWKAREDFDRDNYWWFKIGSTAFRIPKPFEVGAAGTVAERTWELFNNKEMTGSRYMGRIADVVGQQFSMNPTPQIIKPFMDVYSNKDSFTGRPIEGMALQKLQPEDRYSPSTSMTARFLGQLGLPDPTQFVNGRYTKLSPVQVDSLLHGYFGWLGTMALGTVDTIVRPMTNEGARPARTLSDYTMGFADNLPSSQSRYVTQMYDNLTAIEQAYNSYHTALKTGQYDKARNELQDNRALIGSYHMAEAAKRTESMLTLQEKRIQNSTTLSADTKRTMLNRVAQQRAAIAERISSAELSRQQ